jgi:hypothetical protein
MSAPAEMQMARGFANLAELADADLQSLLAAVIREYAARGETRDDPLPALPPESGVTATEAMLAVSAILKAVNIQVFELGMWQSWSGR